MKPPGHEVSSSGRRFIWRGWIVACEFEAFYVALSLFPLSLLSITSTPSRVAMVPNVGGSGQKLGTGRFIGTWGPHAGSDTL